MVPVPSLFLYRNHVGSTRIVRKKSTFKYIHYFFVAHTYDNRMALPYGSMQFQRKSFSEVEYKFGAPENLLL